MFFTAAVWILGVKNLSPTQTQAIGYTNIPSDLHLALGLCISLVVFKNHFKIGLLVITMVKYVFAAAASILGVTKPVTHKNPSNWLYKHSQLPSLSFWIVHQLGCFQKLFQNCTASNYYGEICFCCSSFNSSSKKTCHLHKPKPLAIPTFKDTFI